MHLWGEILSCCFDPTGQNIAACSADRSVSTRATLIDASHQASNRRRSNLPIEVEAKAVEEHKKYV
ncbi:hypothetical protein C8J57DRAFT_1332906, partial [Mycena rebaudengoi]